jgi:outer membrane protein OmpA-like peptidoglycan-associated protein
MFIPKTYCCLFLALIFSPEVWGQAKNLVLNPSFELFEKCPQDHTPFDKSHKLIPSWTYPTYATPDYFNRCSSGQVRVPSNFAGVSEPKTGNAYMGAILTGTERDYREYFQGTLSEPMEKGKMYCVSFHYRLASMSKFAVDQLSLFFVDLEIKSTIKANLAVEPQLINRPGLFLDNIEEWEQFCQVYTAKGGERYFVAGNFKSYDHTNYVVTDKNVTNLRDKQYAYYFFDDFSVKLLENCNDCPCVPQNMDVVVMDSSYSGGLDLRTGVFKGKLDDGRIALGIQGGTAPYTVSWSNSMSGPSLKGLPAGSYSYTVKDVYNCTAMGKITFKEPEAAKDTASDDLLNIQEGAAIVLKNIFFEYNKTNLLPASYPELDKVVSFIKETGAKLIEISGHTDSDGADAYNKTLSQGRAKAVVNYLISKGIEAERLIAVGFGESRPVDTNLTVEGKSQNRRVEFLLKKK